jgi:hypothetical protein
MQAHIHDLRTIDRPLVLREYLGNEVPGTGLQWDQWFAASDTTTVRYSFAVLTAVAGPFEAHGHADELPAGSEPEFATPTQPEYRDLGQLDFTARLTGFSEFGDGAHTVQYGGSGRFVPDFDLTSDEAGVAPVDGLSNSVWGLDLTYGWQNDTGNRGFSAGLSWLWNTGDLSGIVETQPDQSEIISVLDGTATGFYTWGEYRWAQQRHAIGAQWSQAQTITAGLPEADEYDLYYTWFPTELSRVRFEITMLDQEGGPRSWRAAIQLTAFLGPHAHGVNW